jgi:hypothetical protein
MVKYVRMDTQSFEGNTSVQAEHENRSTKKPRRCILPAPSAIYPVCFGLTAEKYVVPFEKNINSYRSFLELKVYLNALKLAEEQVVFKEEVLGEGYFPEDDSDEFDKEFPGVGKSRTRMSTFRQMLTAECEMEIHMKPREVLTAPYRFICDYAELGPTYLKVAKQQMNLAKIAMLEFYKNQGHTNNDDNSDGLISSHLPIETKTKWVRGKSGGRNG